MYVNYSEVRRSIARVNFDDHFEVDEYIIEHRQVKVDYEKLTIIKVHSGKKFDFDQSIDSQ